ncbi:MULTISPECIES: Type 1 glutamine amidotransferase-like domain-containing protein [unclassified Pseudoclavibacter]|uniref:Type 1 glutamine amidotransferase-like domain-containing protein n=1 Tax=unclassified Pseudoclavibacter TaxID=2615177 RepID=UPI000CE7D20A|nr:MULTISPECIES: Type 1 glutamine amidotransferase-like domain-containing protein [unclassified Pseudoclavibacter]MBF4549625.1 Type 1 glutamine amidotransferase-like domain-containing protein [Pseudoclavibacter sp. VKM Ac-2888]PPG03000.1 peptidase S51 [Pseudoclavibacter sp. RFBI5]
MSIFLVGGGDGSGVELALAQLADEARSRAAGATPVIAVIAVGENPEPVADWFADRLRSVDPGVLATPVLARSTASGEPLDEIDLASFSTAHGILVCGGHTPAYLAALAPLATDIRRLVAEGVSYLGYSAGAAIAADEAIIGGWRIGGVPVAPEESGEGLDEVTFEAGLGLVDLTIEAHAAQWGLVALCAASIEAGLAERILAVDEDTVLKVGEGALEILGSGSVWQLTAGEGGVTVSSSRASE